MNGFELNRIISNDPLLWRTFIGVFAADQLNFHIAKRPACLISNTDNANMPGTHWVAIYFDVRGNAFYFDSFGRNVYSQQFDKFLKMNAKRIHVNKKRLQSSDTLVCGMYCIYFLYYITRNILNSFKRFSALNYLFNDKIVCRFMFKHFRVRHNVCF